MDSPYQTPPPPGTSLSTSIIGVFIPQIFFNFLDFLSRMAEPDQNQTVNSSSSSVNRDSSDAASSSFYSPPPVPEVEEVHVVHVLHEYGNPELEEQPIVVSYSGNVAAFDDRSSVIGDDTWSCVIVVLTFWFFVSMTMILGVYGSVKFQLGPNCSFLIKPNPLFVEYLKVEGLDNLMPGPILYGFYKSPPLDDVTTWSENHSVSVPAGSHKEWIYFLNEGSQIDISYNVHSPRSSIFLIIAQGNESLAQWREDPTYPNTTLSWNIIHGQGMIQQNILRPSSYFVALGNLNSEEVKVQLNLRVKAYLYNTTEAYYKCTFTNGPCNFNVLFPEGSAAVLTSPGSEQGTANDEWSVRLSYGPRWVTYIVGTGGMTALMFLAFNFLNKFRCTREEETRVQFGRVGSEHAPLLSYKDDDLSSWGSSYDSAASIDEEDLENILAMNSLEGKPVKDGENSNNTRRLCAICYDAPRDCFFLPCGHCVSCFACGTRIAEAAGTCPICRRNMKKVRKIFTV